MGRLSISDLEKLSGIRAHTIRTWEQRYQFLKPCRTETNIRYYCASELKLLLDIALLNKKGLKVSQINSLSKEEISALAGRVEEPELKRENRLNEMIAAMIDNDMDRFEDILDEEIANNGVESAIEDLVLPFLVRSGLFWNCGHLDEASEDLVSHILRQKLIVAIETTTPKNQLSETVLLFLPENDHHELGLLYWYYRLKSRGYQTLYLGCNLPLSDLVQVANNKKPDRILTHLVNAGNGFRLDQYVKQLKKNLPEAKIVISGYPEHKTKNWPENFVHAGFPAGELISN